MQQDLFDRASGRARRTTTIALVLVIVGVLGIIFTIMQHRKAADDVHPFVSLEDSQGKVVTLNLHWVDTNLAEDTKNNRWYHFAQTTDGQDLVLDTGRETHDEINNMMSADPRQEKLKTEPFTYTGYVQSTDSELRPYISERWLGYEDMLFCQFKYDGSDFKILSENRIGSGHPSVEAGSRFLVTDAYIKQHYVVVDDEVPIRLIDLKEDREYILCTIANDVGGGGEMYTADDRKMGGSQNKLDPHPAWSRDYKKLCINGAPDGKRKVFIIDIKEWMA